ncbi:MAG: hypothetical protein COA70_13880 [Planctomycetota bacterium]|nr:MAG: hypothetical protein COA70_13880 [Planctomycetota bacterium]
MRTEQGAAVEEGWIDFAPNHVIYSDIGALGKEVATRVAITSGDFKFPSWWIEDGDLMSASFLVLDPNGIPSQVLKAELNIDLDLLLVVGKGRSFSCLVQDIEGDPVSGAFVQVFAPYPLEELGGFADSNGVLNGTVYGASSKLGFRAFADGFAWSSSAVDIEQEPTFVIELQPIYAAVFLVRDWVGINLIWGLIPGDLAHNCSRWPGMRYIRERIVRDLPAPPAGSRYEVRLAKIDSPLGTTIPTTSLGFWGNSFDTMRAVKAAMVKVTDGTPEVVVVESKAYPKNILPSLPVDITIEPQTAFLAEAPMEISLPFVGKKNEHNVIRVGKKISGTTYQFFLPEGEYEVTVGNGELLDSDKYTESLPRFLANETIEVTFSNNRKQVVNLHPGERYIRFDVRFAGVNRTTNIAVELAPNDGVARTIWPSLGTLPQPRFIRPGTFNLHYINRHQPSNIADMFQILVGDLIWPSPVKLDGTWIIDIQKEILEPESYTAG